MRPPRRRILALAAALLGVTALVLGVASLVFSRLVHERSEIPPPSTAAAPNSAGAAEPTPPEPPRGAEVLAVTGQVERRAGEGRWDRVEAGEVVGSDQALRTGRGSRANLSLGPKARLEVAEGTEIEVREVSPELHRVKLTRGRVGVAYEQSGKRVLRIEGPEGDAVAEAASARFSVVSAGFALAVATETGIVDLKTARGAVAVRQGEQAEARPGEAPLAPTPIPIDVLLKVAGARAGRGAQGSCDAVQGQVAPATEVRVDGEPVEVAADGRFRARLRKKPGPQVATVWAKDVAGRVAERSVRCGGEALRPLSDFRVRWGRAHAR